MCISFTPFPTRVVADHASSSADRQAAAVLYGLTMTVTAICFFGVWYYGSRRLLRPEPAIQITADPTMPRIPRKLAHVINVIRHRLQSHDLRPRLPPHPPRVQHPSIQRHADDRPAPDEALIATPVSRRVNSVANDDAACLGPPEAEAQRSLF